MIIVMVITYIVDFVVFINIIIVGVVFIALVTTHTQKEASHTQT